FRLVSKAILYSSLSITPSSVSLYFHSFPTRRSSDLLWVNDTFRIRPRSWTSSYIWHDYGTTIWNCGCCCSWNYFCFYWFYNLLCYWSSHSKIWNKERFSEEHGLRKYKRICRDRLLFKE